MTDKEIGNTAREIAERGNTPAANVFTLARA